MSSLRSQDGVSLCRFTFADGRQCRTPRSPNHPPSAVRATLPFLNSAPSASLPHSAIIISVRFFSVSSVPFVSSVFDSFLLFSLIHLDATHTNIPQVLILNHLRQH
jgi:hypothetical protein